MRNQIRDVQEYKDLVRSTKKRLGGKVRSNCLLMSSYFALPASEGRLFCDVLDNGLLVYLDEGSYLTMYYFWKPEAELEVVRQEKPIIVEELAASGVAKPVTALFYEKAGLRKMRTNLQYALDVDVQPEGSEALAERCQSALDHVREQGFTLRPCVSVEQQADILALWEQELELGDVPADHRDFVERGDGSVVYVAEREGVLAGTYWWKDERRTVRSGRHIVTSPLFVRRGIASALLAACVQDAQARGMRQLVTWIASSNRASIGMHEKFGFVATGRLAEQYVLDAIC